MNKITDVEIVQALHWPFVRIHTDAGISGIGVASLQQKELAVAPHNSNGPISTVASVHLDACTPNAVIQELVVRRLPVYNELLTEPLVVQGGYIQLPEGPGWRVDIREDAEERFHAQMLPAIEKNARYYYEWYPLLRVGTEGTSRCLLKSGARHRAQACDLGYSLGQPFPRQWRAGGAADQWHL